MLLLLLACTENICDELPSGEARIVAVGDSILAWNGPDCQTVVDHAALALAEPIDNAAINGARLLDEEEPIASQMPEGEYEIVLVDGGANDLNGGLSGGLDVCEGGELDEALDRIEAEMARLVDAQLALQREVWILDYYRMPEGARYGFEACEEELDLLEERYRGLAEAREGVELLDLEEAVGDEELELFDNDKVHPSPEGAAVLGAFVAEALLEG